MTPVYVPLHKVNAFMDCSKAHLEIKLLKCIYPVTNQEQAMPNETRFMFADTEDIMGMSKPVSQKFMSKKILDKRKTSKSKERIIKSRLSIKRNQSNL